MARKRTAAKPDLRLTDGVRHEVQVTVDYTVKRLMDLAKTAQEVTVDCPDGQSMVIPASEVKDLWMAKARERMVSLRTQK